MSEGLAGWLELNNKNIFPRYTGESMWKQKELVLEEDRMELFLNIEK